MWCQACSISIQRIFLQHKKPKSINSRQSRLTVMLKQIGNQDTLDWSQTIFSRHRLLSTKNKIKSKETKILVHSTITLRCRIYLWAVKEIGTRPKTGTVDQLTLQVQFYNKNLKIVMAYHLRNHQITQLVKSCRISSRR